MHFAILLALSLFVTGAQCKPQLDQSFSLLHVNKILPSRFDPLFPDVVTASASRELLRLLVIYPLLIAVIWLITRKSPKIALAIGSFARSLLAYKGTPYVLLGVSFLLYLIVSIIIIGGIPHFDDGICNLYQAKILANGKFYSSVPAQLIPHVKVLHTVYYNGRLFSRFFPGYPLLLVPGILVGAPWLINPLLGALLGFVIYLLARLLFDHTTAVIAQFLYMVSPFALFMNGTYLAHTATAFWGVLFVYSILRAFYGRHRYLWGVIAGFSFGFAALTRPFDAVLILVPILFLLIYKLFRAFSQVAPIMPFMIAGYIILLALGYFYNYQVTGDMHRHPYTVEQGLDNIGFTDQPRSYGVMDIKEGIHKGHTPLDGLYNLWLNLYVMSVNLLGFPFVSLLLPILTLLSPYRGRKEIFLFSFNVSFAIFYMLYWAHSALMLVGARYYYPTIPFMIILAARGLIYLSGSVSDDKQTPDRRFNFSSLLVTFLIVESMVAYVPRVASAWMQETELLRLVPTHVKRQGIENAVVHIDTQAGVNVSARQVILNGALAANSPFYDSSVIYARIEKGRAAPMGLFPGKVALLADIDFDGKKHSVRLKPIILDKP